MAAKPTDKFRWGDVSGDIVVPTSGKKDVGWVADEEPPAQYMNYLQNGAGQWFSWLYDGDCAFDALTATSVEASDYITTTEGDIRHAEIVERIPFPYVDGLYGGDYLTNGVVAGTISAGAVYWEGAAGGEFAVDLPIKTGDRLKTVRVRVFDNTGGGNIAMQVWKQSIASGAAAGAPAQLGGTQTSSNVATNLQDLAVTGLTETAVVDTVYRVIVSIGADSGLKFYGGFFSYDRVA